MCNVYIQQVRRARTTTMTRRPFAAAAAPFPSCLENVAVHISVYLPPIPHTDDIILPL